MLSTSGTHASRRANWVIKRENKKIETEGLLPWDGLFVLSSAKVFPLFLVGVDSLLSAIVSFHPTYISIHLPHELKSRGLERWWLVLLINIRIWINLNSLWYSSVLNVGANDIFSFYIHINAHRHTYTFILRLLLILRYRKLWNYGENSLYPNIYLIFS